MDGGSQFQVDGLTHYQRNKDYYRSRNKNRRQEIRDFLRMTKLESGCIDCGYDKHHFALDFDHVYGDKLMNPSKMITYMWGDAKIAAELAKCVVRCANCHRVVTFERLNGVVS